MKKREFKVAVETDVFGDTSLQVTHNNSQWSTIRIYDAALEIPQIIAELQRHMAAIERDTAVPVQPATRGKNKLFKT